MYVEKRLHFIVKNNNGEVVFQGTNTNVNVATNGRGDMMSGYVYLDPSGTATIDINSGLNSQYVRYVYIESSAPCNVSLLDATGTDSEITTVPVDGNSTYQHALIEMKSSWTVAASDTLVITAGATAANVSWCIIGDSDA
jgi:hypothetical protein